MRVEKVDRRRTVGAAEKRTTPRRPIGDGQDTRARGPPHLETMTPSSATRTRGTWEEPSAHCPRRLSHLSRPHQRGKK